MRNDDSDMTEPRAVPFLRRLARDRSGNTFAIVAASIAPLLAMIGGGIDMGRSYLSQARLQQACDSGVLAARKRLGSAIVTDGQVPSTVVDVGNRFFELNFRDGAYGTRNRTFQMALEENYAISGIAQVDVPTTIMALFGNKNMPLKVECEANLNFSNTDVMFVLDTTGSMNDTNPGDSVSRIDAMRQVVRDFHAQLEGSKTPGTRIRYGFVPYSTNVNVGRLLRDDWVVNEWTYQSRVWKPDPASIYTQTDWMNWTYKSGSSTDKLVDSYKATWVPGSGEYSSGSYQCKRPNPANTATYDDTLLSTRSEPYAGPPEGTKVTEHYKRVVNGKEYSTSLSGDTCNVNERTHDALVLEFDKVSYPKSRGTWLYKPVVKDVSKWRSESNGCMEERSTYEIYSMSEPVDFDRALDLNIDMVPIAGNPDTQWRPMYPNVIWERKIQNENANNFSVAEVEFGGNYFRPADYPGLVACPTPARKLAEMNAGQVDSYLASLRVQGQTYHDIGMIWGGRLISPTGIFADENADVNNRPTTRHLIFLTDGQTQPMGKAYTSYGVEPLDNRRWTDRPDPLLDRTIEMRFAIACEEVKNKNVTVWVVGFGTAMNDVMVRCAGDGHHFTANNADDLKNAFKQIAKSLAELRVSR